MELWIRSQDKEELIKVVDIYKVADANEIWAQSDRYVKTCLGFYKSKERALEVLDEIQNHIKKLGKMELDNDKGLIYYGNIYEMPKE